MQQAAFGYMKLSISHAQAWLLFRLFTFVTGQELFRGWFWAVHRVGGDQSREAMESLATQWLLCAGRYQSSGLQRNDTVVPWVTVATAVVTSRLFAATSVRIKHSTDPNSVHFFIFSLVGNMNINKWNLQWLEAVPIGSVLLLHSHHCPKVTVLTFDL